MALVLYDAQDGPTHPGQAIIDKVDVAAIVAAFSNPASGWASSTAITGTGTALAVITSSGTAVVNGTTYAAVGGTISGIPSPTNDRRDIVTWDPIAGFAYHLGAECTVVNWTPSSGVLGPIKPVIPASAVLYAETYLVGGASVVNTADCMDKSCPVTAGAATPPVTLIDQLIFTR